MLNRLRTYLLVSTILLCGIVEGLIARERDEAVPQVRIKFFALRISRELAKTMGLDGGLAPDPKKTPLKTDIPAIMTKSQARKVITALRKDKKTELFGSATALVQSGEETFMSNVVEVVFPEFFDPVPAEKKGENVQPESFTPLPVRLNDARDDLGTTLTVTPQVATNGFHISLEIHPKIVEHVKSSKDWLAIPPVFIVAETRTNITLRSGCTALVGSGTGTRHAALLKESKSNLTTLFFLEAEVVKQPVDEKK